MDDPTCAKRQLTTSLASSNLIKECQRKLLSMLDNWDSFTEPAQIRIMQQLTLFHGAIELINSPHIDGIDFVPADDGLNVVREIIHFLENLQNN